MVMHRGSSRRGDLLSPTLSRPDVLVRRLQPRLGGHSRRPVRFRGFVGGRGLSLDQPSRVVGRRERPQGSLFLSGRSGCRSLLRKHHHDGVSEKARRDFGSDPKRGSPAHSALGGTVEHDLDASVCSWQEQLGGGRPVSPQSSSRLGVDAPSGSVQLAPPALAGDNRPVCFLTQSPLFCLFWYRCHAPVMGFSTGICLPSIRHDQSGPGEGEGLPGSGAHAHSSILASASVVSGAARAADSAPSSSISVGSSASATRQKIPPKPVHASSSCVETLRRFARASGFSRCVARRLGQARRQSSVASYQSNWLTYRRWCTDKGHSVSQPSVLKVADYLVWLWEDQDLSLSSVKAHHSMLSSVFRFKLPSLGEDRVLQDLLRSFAIERPCRPQAPPSWDLDAVQRHLMSSAFEPLESVSQRALTKKTLFLVSLAAAKRVSEIQALSMTLAAIGNDLMVSFLPHFIAKTERVDAPVPRNFRVLWLREFAGDLEDGSLLCPVLALNIYLWRTSSVVVRASYLFVSPRSPSRPISKNAVLYFLREVISEAGALRQDVAAPLRAHIVRGVATCFFPAELVDLPRCWRPQLGDRIQCSLLFISATFLMFFKDCDLLARLSQRAVLLTPRNLFLGVFLITGIRFWVLVFILRS